jgi:hypothetical protein
LVVVETAGVGTAGVGGTTAAAGFGRGL